jgi:hypothetical protein
MDVSKPHSSEHIAKRQFDRLAACRREKNAPAPTRELADAIARSRGG